ncbi:AAA family ATPase [Occultella gossypii]|uniref:AAA family ATPase n=1 Tax=Occultella gossypii TaxID=2800820 RepID=A0ABS7S3R4_9MICO|nr:AAA family ATPase [Occultella gossypii]MBZ2194960.1 AAA family ATPase [Occultella gossypii]
MRAERPGLERPVVVVFTGLPGTGKSTMADRTAVHLGAPAFSGDWLMGALQPAAGQLAQLDRETYSRVYYGLLGSLLTRQLLLGQSAVLDCLVTEAVVAAWRSTAARHGADLRVIECVCSDLTVHRSRVVGRVRGIPGWHEIDWAHVERMRAEFPALGGERLTLDAVLPVDRNFGTVSDYLHGQ